MCWARPLVVNEKKAKSTTGVQLIRFRNVYLWLWWREREEESGRETESRTCNVIDNTSGVLRSTPPHSFRKKFNCYQCGKLLLDTFRLANKKAPDTPPHTHTRIEWQICVHKIEAKANGAKCATCSSEWNVFSAAFFSRLDFFFLIWIITIFTINIGWSVWLW